MTGALTPAQALAYLLELSPDVTGATVVDRAGAIIASRGANATGDPGPRARPPRPASPDGEAVVRVSDGEFELVAVMGGRALPELVRADAASALAAVRRRC